MVVLGVYKRWSFFVLAFLLSLIIRLPVNSQSASEFFVYMVRDLDDSGTATIYGIDPHNPTQAITLRTILVSDDEFVAGGGYLSPNSEWLVLEVDRRLTPPGNSMLRALNLRTGEIVNMIDDINIATYPHGLGGDRDPQVYSWSPDSRYFAVSYEDYLVNEAHGTFLYDFETRTLTHLTPPGTNHNRLAWSNDSRYLATTSHVCDSGHCSKAAIDIFDAETATLANSVDVSHISASPGGQSTGFCELQWSPDDAYLSFVGQCDANVVVTHVDAYVLRVSDSTIHQTTNFFPVKQDPAELIYQANYDTNWLDARTLLIGTVIDEGLLKIVEGQYSATDQPRRTASYIYDAVDQTMTKISDQQFTDGAVSGNHLAYTALTYPDDPALGALPVGAEVQIAAFDGHSLSVLASGPLGCNPSWNSTGDILAYIAEDEFLSLWLCNPSGQTLHFLNLTDGNIQSYELPDRYVSVLGWIQMPDSADSP